MSHTNTLYHGDNRSILQEQFAGESVDLVYVDPPFNSGRSYRASLRGEDGAHRRLQPAVFDDVWHWDEAARQAYEELVTGDQGPTAAMVAALRSFIGANSLMAYLVMMAIRLVELRRVLKPSGSLYLHCDPAASHYLKIMLDTVFGIRNFRNEIIWKRTNSHNDARRKFADLADTIYFYSKGSTYTYHPVYVPYSEDYVRSNYRQTDEQGRRYTLRDLRSPNPRPNLTYTYKGYAPHKNGWSISRERMAQLESEGRLHFPKKPTGRLRMKRYLDEMPGVPLGNVWDDIAPVQAHAAERLGFPTQKPLLLLERIISAGSNEGDLVLDPFCGCGTTIHAAHNLNREWVGIDNSGLALSLQQRRLREAFGLVAGSDYAVEDAAS